LRFAEATNRLDLYERGGEDLPGVIERMQEGGASGKARGVLSGAKEALLGRGDEEEEPEERPRRRPAKKAVARRRRDEQS
jgi:hypothetical protein